MNMRKIYRQIAKAHGVTVAEVRQEMQAAIREAYRGKQQGEETIPTPEEVVLEAVTQIQHLRAPT